MLDYVVKLTRNPGGMTADDTDALRSAGFSDRAILDICQVASYYAYVNRLADGLGVELEKEWRDEDCTLPRDEFEALREARRRKIDTHAGARKTREGRTLQPSPVAAVPETTRR